MYNEMQLMPGHAHHYIQQPIYNPNETRLFGPWGWGFRPWGFGFGFRPWGFGFGFPFFGFPFFPFFI